MTDGSPYADRDPDRPNANAFVDGRVTEEKLAELLTFPEGTHLEFACWGSGIW